MNDVKCTIIQDLLPLYVDKVCSSDSAELVKNHLQSCTECKKIYDEMTADLEGELPCPEVDGKKAFQSLRDRKSTRLNSSHYQQSRMPSSA